jgi:transaldolase
VVKKICSLLPKGVISVEVTEQKPEKVFEQAKKIAALAPNIAVKIPCFVPYFPIIKKLVRSGVTLNITLVFSVSQALALCKLGVAYVSPFIGRLDDAGKNGIDVLYSIMNMVELYEYKTQVLAASVRSQEHIEQIIASGAQCMTLPVELFETMLAHPLTTKGMVQFDADWKKLKVSKFP